jgi:phage shock protein C
VQGERRTFYRDKFNGKLLGVCSGLGDYFNIDPLWFRLLFIALFFMINIFVFILYFAIVMLTPKKPPHLYTDSLSRTFAEPYVAPRAGDLISPATRKGIDDE